MNRTPYTYLIGWSKLDRWYYGARYAKGCYPGDLWVTYFTSSDLVASLRIEHGAPDVVTVRRIFEESKATLIWEKKVLRRLNAVKDVRWLNQNYGGAGSDSTNPAVKKKIGDANRGRKRTPEQRAAMSARFKGIPRGPMSEETKDKLRAINIGKKTSEETKAKLRIASSGVNNPNYGGKHHTEEVKQRMRKPKLDSSKMGRRVWTEEQRAAVSIHRKGKVAHINPISPEHKKMFIIGNSPSGWVPARGPKEKIHRIWTEEQKDNISASKVGKKAHINDQYPGIVKMIKPGSEKSGWRLKNVN